MASRATKRSVASKGSGDKDDYKRREEIMREFVSEYGRGIRQENVRLKTKEITGTLPYSLSMRPDTVTAPEEVEEIVLECQTVNAPNVNRGNSVRVRVQYRRDDVVAIRHNLRREPSPYTG
jgi:ribosomal protein S18